MEWLRLETRDLGKKLEESCSHHFRFARLHSSEQSLGARFFDHCARLYDIGRENYHHARTGAIFYIIK